MSKPFKLCPRCGGAKLIIVNGEVVLCPELGQEDCPPLPPEMTVCEHGFFKHKCRVCGLEAENAELQKRVAELEAARQFAADLVEDLRKQRDKFAMMAREITCVWCGHQFDSTIQSQADHLYDHAKRCEKHPIRKVEAKLAEAVELLRPFADGHLYFDEEHANKSERERDEMPLNYYDWRINTPKVGDCRKAAAFVAENGKVKS